MNIVVEDKKTSKSMITVKHMNRVQYEENQSEEVYNRLNSGIQQITQQRNQGADDKAKQKVTSIQDKSIRLSKLNEEEAAIIFENRKKELFENLMTQIKRNSSNSATRKKAQNYASSLNTSINKERSSSVGKNRSQNNQSSSQNVIQKLMKASSCIDNSHQQQVGSQKTQLQLEVTKKNNKQKQENSLERPNHANNSSTDKKFIIYNDKGLSFSPNQILKKGNSFSKNPVSSDRESINKSRSNAPKTSDNQKSKLKTNYALLNQLKKESPKQNENERSRKSSKEIKVNNYISNSIHHISNSGVFTQKTNNTQNEQEAKQRDGLSSEKIGMTASTQSLNSAHLIATKNKTPSKITSQQKGIINNDKEFGILLQNGNKQNLIPSSQPQKIQGQQQSYFSQIQSKNNNNISTNFIRSNSLYLSSQENQIQNQFTINLVNIMGSSSQQPSPKRSYLKSQNQGDVPSKQNLSQQELYCSQSSNASILQTNPNQAHSHRPSSTISDISSANNLSNVHKFGSNNGSAIIKSNSDRPQQNMLSYAKIYNNLITQAKNTQTTISDISPIERNEKKIPQQNFYSANYNYQNNAQILRKQESDSSTQAFDSDQEKQVVKCLQTLSDNNVQKQNLDSKLLSLSYVKLQSQALIKKQLEKQKNNNKQENPNAKQELLQNIGDLKQQIVQIEKNEILSRKPSLHLDTSPFSKISTQDQSSRDLQQMLQNSKQNPKSYSSMHKSGKALIGTNSISNSRSRDHFQQIQQSNKNHDLPQKPFSSQASTPRSKKKIQFSTNLSTTAANTGEKTPLKSILVNGKNSSHSIERQTQGFCESTQNQLGFSDSLKQKDITATIDNQKSQSNLSQYKIQQEKEDEDNMKKSRNSSQNDLSYKSLSRINSASFIDFRPKNSNYKSKTQIQQTLVRKMSENENLYTDIKNKVITPATTSELKTLSSCLVPPSSIKINGFQSQKSQKVKTLDSNERQKRHPQNNFMFNSQVSSQQYSINNGLINNDFERNSSANSQLIQNDRSNRQKYI